MIVRDQLGLKRLLTYLLRAETDLPNVFVRKMLKCLCAERQKFMQTNETTPVLLWSLDFNVRCEVTYDPHPIVEICRMACEQGITRRNCCLASTWPHARFALHLLSDSREKPPSYSAREHRINVYWRAKFEGKNWLAK